MATFLQLVPNPLRSSEPTDPTFRPVSSVAWVRDDDGGVGDVLVGFLDGQIWRVSDFDGRPYDHPDAASYVVRDIARSDRPVVELTGFALQPEE